MNVLQHLGHNHSIVFSGVIGNMHFDWMIAVGDAFDKGFVWIVEQMITRRFDDLLARIDGCDIRLEAS